MQLTPSGQLARPRSDLKAKLFRGLGDPSRLAILEALRGGALTVSEIVAATGLGQPNASNHLACLRECGLVAGEQRGRHVYYRLSDRRVGDLLQHADDLLSDVAGSVAACPRYESPAERTSKRSSSDEWPEAASLGPRPAHRPSAMARKGKNGKDGG